MSEKDGEYFFSTHPNKLIVSRRINDKVSGRDLRLVSQIIETDEEVKFITDLKSIQIRSTPTGRQQIKATVFEDDRSIHVLTIQRFHKAASEWYGVSRQHFSFKGKEIGLLKKFLAAIETVDFDGDGKSQITDADLERIILARSQAEKILLKNKDVLMAVLQDENLGRDFVGLGYRRKQLEVFKKLLEDRDYFEKVMKKKEATPELLWQKFFEANIWIFGYGLSYQFLSNLDDRKLEQIVDGFALDAPGKRIDGLLKSRGAMSNLCFVEIKRHDTELVKSSAYRSGAWPVSNELIGGVAQLQATVRAARNRFGEILRPVKEDGSPTGEEVRVVSPKSFLVIGSLSEFDTPEGSNHQKFGCFEDFRRNLANPEILTFDELFERARHIVEMGS